MQTKTITSRQWLRTWLGLLILVLFSLDAFAAAKPHQSKSKQPMTRPHKERYDRITVAIDKEPIIILTEQQKARLRAAGISRMPFMDRNFTLHYFDLDGKPINLCDDQPPAEKGYPPSKGDNCTLEATAMGLTMLLSGASDCGSCWKRNIARICWKRGPKEDKFACPDSAATNKCKSNCN